MVVITEFPPAPATTRGVPCRISINAKTHRVAYSTGRNVFLRDLNDLNKVQEYNRHRNNVTAVRFAPSGMWVATGDDSGRLDVWDTTNPEEDRVVKTERPCFNGRVNDIAWSPDSKRLVVVGAGRDVMGEAFTAEGASLGVLTGHSAEIVTCDFRTARPFFISTGGTDQAVNQYKGPPFKFMSSAKAGNTVNCVRYSPDGQHVAAVGADKCVTIYSYDADQKEFIESATVPAAHTRGIYGVAWAPDSSQLATCSADGTVALRGVDGAVTATMTDPLHGTIKDQQLAVDWDGEHLISVALDGTLRFWDPSTGQLTRRIEAHQKPINAAVIVGDRVLTTDQAGVALHHGVGATLALDAASVSGALPKNSLVAAAPLGEGSVAGSMSGPLVFIDAEFTVTDTMDADGTPAALATIPGDGDTLAVVTNTSLTLYNGRETVATVTRDDLLSVAISGPAGLVAAGDTKGGVTIYTLSDLTEVTRLTEHPRDVSALAFNEDGTLLATGDGNKRIVVWNAADWSVLVPSWSYHSARIRQLAWHGRRLASVSNDRSVRVWNVDEPTERFVCPEIHREGALAVAWVNEESLVTAGADGAVKLIDVTKE